MNKLKTDILIIGAGPAGLACAYELTKAKRDFILVEKDGVVGGLAKTYEFNEEGLVFRTDNGPHRFFSENSDLYRLIEELLGNEWIKVRRQTRQFIDGKFYDYPVNFGQALKNIGLLKAGRMLADYARAKIEYGLFRKKIENFSDYVTANFGRTLGEFNMINYTEKIWGRKASEIHPDWAGQRIKGLDLISLVMNSLAGSLLRKGGDSPKTLVDVFYYPRAGTGSIYETIARRVRQADKMIMLDTEPMEIHHSHGRFSRTVLSSAGQTFEIEFDTLVESVPMKKFIELQRPQPDNSILDPKEKLQYTSQVYLFITPDKGSITNDQWIYFPTKDIPFARVSEMRNFSVEMSPPGKTSLFCEFFCTEGDRIWSMPKDELFRLALEHFRKLGFFNKDAVRRYYVFRQKNVYPVYDVHYLDYLAKLKSYLNHFENLYYIGRPGRFRYNNYSLEMGLLAAKSIIDGQKYDIEAVGEEKEYFEKGAIPTTTRV